MMWTLGSKCASRVVLAADKPIGGVRFLLMNSSDLSFTVDLGFWWMFALHGAERLSSLEFDSEASNGCLVNTIFLIKGRPSCSYLLLTAASVTTVLQSLYLNAHCLAYSGLLLHGVS